MGDGEGGRWILSNGAIHGVRWLVGPRGIPVGPARPVGGTHGSSAEGGQRGGDRGEGPGGRRRGSVASKTSDHKPGSCSGLETAAATHSNVWRGEGDSGRKKCGIAVVQGLDFLRDTVTGPPGHQRRSHMAPLAMGWKAGDG